MIKAIETVYDGYRFRSRLEARWAVFFNALGVKYEYEPEGFEFRSGGVRPVLSRVVTSFYQQTGINLSLDCLAMQRLREEVTQCVINYRKRILVPFIASKNSKPVHLDVQIKPENIYETLYYLPDFRINDWFFEVKGGNISYDDLYKVASFASCGQFTVIAEGNIGDHDLYTALVESCNDVVRKRFLELQQCPYCKHLGYIAHNLFRCSRSKDCPGRTDKRVSDFSSINAAYVAARQARFEHGETPHLHKVYP